MRLNKPDGSTYWRNTDVTNHRGNDYAKLQQFAVQCLNIDGCIAIRIAKGVGSPPAQARYSSSLPLWWRPREPGNLSTYGYDCSETLSMRHYFPEKWSEVRIIQIRRSSGVNFTKRSLHEPVMDSAQGSNSDPDRQQRENNHDLTGRVDDANDDIHATSSPSDSGLLAPILEESTPPSTSEFDETDQLFTHEEPDLRHAVYAAYLACLEESGALTKSESSGNGGNIPT